MGRKWKIGQKGKNNGIVILWAPQDRKINIQTGYGMEGALPDAYAKRIIEQEIKPNFRELRYYEGLNRATDRIITYAKGEFKADENADEEISLLPILFFFLILIFIIYLMSRGGGNRGSGNRGSRGNWMPYTTYSGWGTSSGNWGSGGGSSWGSSSGGGGFGGFGGGDFGGGGASGDY